ncbi:hypothetical protein THAOC_20219 [Thalassiosira oceanica]|uniref:Uncharacterized protein n=1 Tax=Thalassiosira oceanica TaxID=159749 RepID=K0S2T1_THAOC|nr:hypothetical protein THAOC_20219 [Thalassiosira oceanica]|eukprot:EJK59540.1 hypothetical protein THAOC_20219 [Thalassiosira oceanica]
MPKTAETVEPSAQLPSSLLPRLSSSQPSALTSPGRREPNKSRIIERVLFVENARSPANSPGPAGRRPRPHPRRGHEGLSWTSSVVPSSHPGRIPPAMTMVARQDSGLRSSRRRWKRAVRRPRAGLQAGAGAPSGRTRADESDEPSCPGARQEDGMERMAWRSDVDLLHRQSAASFIGMGPARDGGGGGAEGRGSGSRGGTLGKWEGETIGRVGTSIAPIERKRGQRRKRAAVTVRGGVIAASSIVEGAPETAASRGPQGVAITAAVIAELKTSGLASSLSTKRTGALSSTTARQPAVHVAMAEAQEYLATTAASESPGELQTPKEAEDGSDAGGDGDKHAEEYPFGELGSPHREGRRGDPVHGWISAARACVMSATRRCRRAAPVRSMAASKLSYEARGLWLPHVGWSDSFEGVDNAAVAAARGAQPSDHKTQGGSNSL